jgi:hypothetical protein
MALVLVYVATALLPLWHAPSRHHGGALRTTRPVPIAVAKPGSTGGAGPALPLPTPRAARAAAVTYATDTFSVIAGERSDAWIDEVASISTPAWERHLAAATSAATTATSTVSASVVATYPSSGPTGSVGVTVVLHRSGRFVSLYLELRVVASRYLVAATQ